MILFLPVSLFDPRELFGDEAGEGRPHDAAVHRQLRDSPGEQLDVVGRLVHLREARPRLGRELGRPPLRPHYCH